MAARVAEWVGDFKGVDSVSNPTALPPGKALRCKNFCPQRNGTLQLRFGYSKPAMAGATSTVSIHSAVEVEFHNGTRAVLYGQGDRLMRRTVDGSGTITQLATLSNSEP